MGEYSLLSGTFSARTVHPPRRASIITFPHRATNIAAFCTPPTTSQRALPRYFRKTGPSTEASTNQHLRDSGPPVMSFYLTCADPGLPPRAHLWQSPQVARISLGDGPGVSTKRTPMWKACGIRRRWMQITRLLHSMSGLNAASQSPKSSTSRSRILRSSERSCNSRTASVTSWFDRLCRAFPTSFASGNAQAQSQSAQPVSSTYGWKWP